MMVDSVEGKLHSTQVQEAALALSSSSECCWDGEYELPVITAVLCCQIGKGENPGPVSLNWKLGT